MKLFDDISVALSEFCRDNQEAFLYTDSEIIDFTKTFDGNLILLGNKSQLSFTLPDDHIRTLIGILHYSVFAEARLVVSWDIKSLFSYFRYRLPKNYPIDFAAKIIDLKYTERFLDINESCPKTFREAAKRVSVVAKNQFAMRMNDRIYLPLALKTIPAIETLGLAHTELRKVYSHYVIEGQTFGRMSVTKAFPKCIVPHSMSFEEKEKIRPGLEQKFVWLDYKHMEISVLQWLTQDSKLGKIINSGRDLYSVIYHLFFGKPCDDSEKRNLIKLAILPVVFGMQAENLAIHLNEKKINIKKDEAAWLIRQIKEHFPESMEWLQKQQQAAKSHEVCDYFGRPRKHEDSWRARNAVTQGPSAVVCLEKLIQVHDQLKEVCNVVASIHDAFVLLIDTNNFDDTVGAATAIAESPSEMLPGLRLKVECLVGSDWAKLEKYKL